jgi:hypothetical protein
MRLSTLIIILFFLVFFALSAFSSPASGTQDTDPFIGVWKGSLTVASVTLDFSITLSREDEAKMAGTIDIPAQGAAGIRLGNIKIEGTKISFVIDEPGAPGNPTFEGELDDAGKTIAGTFSQSGHEGTFSMDKQ